MSRTAALKQEIDDLTRKIEALESNLKALQTAMPPQNDDDKLSRKETEGP